MPGGAAVGGWMGGCMDGSKVLKQRLFFSQKFTVTWGGGQLVPNSMQISFFLGGISQQLGGKSRGYRT